MPLHVYQYPKCSTCRKALKWLDARGLTYTSTDLVQTPIPAAKLRDLIARSELPIARFFNTSGESYRAGKFKERSKTMTQAQLLSELAKDGKLVKRPIVDTGKRVLVGFDAERYEEELG